MRPQNKPISKNDITWFIDTLRDRFYALKITHRPAKILDLLTHRELFQLVMTTDRTTFDQIEQWVLSDKGVPVPPPDSGQTLSDSVLFSALCVLAKKETENLRRVLTAVLNYREPNDARTHERAATRIGATAKDDGSQQ